MKKSTFVIFLLTFLMIANTAFAITWQEWADQCTYRIRSGVFPQVFDIRETEQESEEYRYMMCLIGHVPNENPYVQLAGAEYDGYVAIRYMNGVGRISTAYIKPENIVYVGKPENDGSTSGGSIRVKQPEVKIRWVDENGEEQNAALKQLGTVFSEIEFENEKLSVPTADLRWDSADEAPMLAVVETSKSGKASMRSKADGKGSAVKSVAAGRIVLVLETGEKYTKVSCDGKEGYMDNEVLRFVPVTAPAGDVLTGAISFKGKTKGTATVNVRLKDTKKSRVIKQFTIGTPVVVIERGSEWTEIDIAGYRGHVMNEFLNVEGE